MNSSILKFKGWLSLLLMLFFSGSIWGQLTLEEALSQARENAPAYVLKQISAAENDLKLKNINTANQPNISIMAQATYQSEVTALDIPLPNIELDPLSKDQYKIQAEISQNIYDGGITNQRKKLQHTSNDLELLGTELELEKVREQIIPAYFAILEMDARLRQLDLKKEDLLARQKVVNAAVENGTLLKMESQSLQAALLLLEQQRVELNAIRKTQLQILGILTTIELSEDTQLQTPANIEDNFTANSKSLRHQFFNLQQVALDQKNDLTLAANRPKLGAFVQGGYGKPGLNFLKNEFAPYYILGARVQWNINGLYTQNKDIEIQNLGKQKIAVQQRAFDQRISTQETLYRVEISKLKLLIANDEELLQLREKIKNTAQVQFDNGVMIAADYLQRLNEENQARQSKSLHKIQLLKNQYLLQHITSNYSTDKN